MTPGPSAGATPDDPQSWNRYSYVQNDPVNFIDPSGLMRLIAPCCDGLDLSLGPLFRPFDWAVGAWNPGSSGWAGPVGELI